MLSTGRIDLLDQAHRSLAPRLAAAGFELIEREHFPDAGPSWLCYRSDGGVAARLLHLTVTTDSRVLAEFWLPARDGGGPQILAQAEWRVEPDGEAELLSAVVAEVERWLGQDTA